jgi:glycosyltransferase involved in cell wall biosynthesis
VVVDGITGRLAAVDDAPAWAEALIDLLKDPVRAGRMGAQGRALVAERFDPALIAAATVDAYERVAR